MYFTLIFKYPNKHEFIKNQKDQYFASIICNCEYCRKHEWYKHGTCAIELPALDTEFKYFSMGLKLNRKLDLLM